MPKIDIPEALIPECFEISEDAPLEVSGARIRYSGSYMDIRVPLRRKQDQGKDGGGEHAND